MSDSLRTSIGLDFEDLFEGALSGQLVLNPSRQIVRCNKSFATWIGKPVEQLLGSTFDGHLAVGARMFFETHLAPLLAMQGYFEEVAVQLITSGGDRRDVLINAREIRDAAGQLSFLHVVAYSAADRIAYESNLRISRDAARSALATERDTAILREQFVAVLGHDLRNPLGVIRMGAAMLSQGATTASSARVLSSMEKSVARMAELIENVMDFARARLGEGIVLSRRLESMEPVLQHAVDELQIQFPHVSIRTEFRLKEEVYCDPARISQLLSNLLSNAITHGAQGEPVVVRAVADDASFKLSVSNAGRRIPPAVLDHLFEPFKREEVRGSQNGLGLGLYIASEIARTHGGSLSGTSTDLETRFEFLMENPDLEPSAANPGPEH